MKHSTANAVCVFPTDRHHCTGTGSAGECSSTWMLGMAYLVLAAPSTDEPSTPSLTAMLSKGVPVRIDWPTIRWCQAVTFPEPSTAPRSA
jgi:hypothetical protein